MANRLQASLKTLTQVGFLEGCSFLLLLGVAMPLKYTLGIHEAVRFAGSAHGVLFIAYLVVLLMTAHRVRFPLWGMPLGVVAAILPFGPFLFDYLLKRAVVKLNPELTASGNTNNTSTSNTNSPDNLKEDAQPVPADIR